MSTQTVAATEPLSRAVATVVEATDRVLGQAVPALLAEIHRAGPLDLAVSDEENGYRRGLLRALSLVAGTAPRPAPAGMILSPQAGTERPRLEVVR